MRLQVTVRRGHVNDDVRRYVESKFTKLGKRAPRIDSRRGRARPRAESADRRRPRRRGGDPRQGPESPRPGGRADLRGGDRPARRPAGAASSSASATRRCRSRAGARTRRASRAGPGRGDRAGAPRPATEVRAAARSRAALGRGRDPRPPSAPRWDAVATVDAPRSRVTRLVRRARGRRRRVGGRGGETRAALDVVRRAPAAVPGRMRSDATAGSGSSGRRGSRRSCLRTIPAATRSRSRGTGGAERADRRRADARRRARPRAPRCRASRPAYVVTACASRGVDLGGVGRAVLVARASVPGRQPSGRSAS